MKVLTLQNPWAWAIIHAGKGVENRSRRTHHRGPLAIHAGRTWSQAGIDALKARGLSIGPAHTTEGMVLGTVQIADCHHADKCQTATGYCSSWALPNLWHWVLADPQPLQKPFPARGQLGLWDLPEGVTP